MITKAVRLPANLTSLLAKPTKVAVLLGSGISISSGFPSGMAFNADLVRTLTRGTKENGALKSCLITNVHDTGVRFEQVIEYLSICTPRWADVFDIFDGAAYPNQLHYWAALSIAQGSAVFTTNFDSLIELAFATLDRVSHQRHRGPLRSVYQEQRADDIDTSFEGQLRSAYSPSLFKLHGSIRRTSVDASGAVTLLETDRSSVGAMLSRIGQRTARFGLPPASSAVLVRHLRNRVLLVIGYSGLDDFDVIPTLCSHVAELKALVWLAHDHRPPRIQKTHDPIPKALRQTLKLASVPATVIKGRTDEIVNLQPMSQIKNIWTTPKRIGDIFPWMSSLESPERHLLIGLILEGANKPRLAMDSYRAAIKAAVKNRSFGLLSIARRKLTHALTSQGEFDKALRTIKTAVNTDRRHDAAALADDYSLLAEVYWTQGRYESSRKVATEALRLHRRLHSLEGEANDLMRLANVNWMEGDIDQGVHLTRAALRINRKLNRKAEVARALINMGSMFRIIGRYKDAISILDEARLLHVALRDEIGLASTLNNLGSVYLDRGDLVKAHRYYSLARDLNRRLGVPDHLATNIGNIGIVHRKRGEYRQALLHYQKALRINSAIGKKEGVVRDLGNIGIAYLELHQLTIARKWLTKSLRMSRRLGKRENEAVQLQNLGIVAERQGNYARAIELFNTSLGINISIKRYIGVCQLLHELGRVHMLQQRYADAKRILLRAYRIASRKNLREDIAVIAQDLASTFSQCNRKQEARRFALISIKEFESLGRREEVRELRRMLKTLQ